MCSALQFRGKKIWLYCFYLTNFFSLLLCFKTLFLDFPAFSHPISILLNFFVILSTCWCVCSGFTILPLSLSWLSALRQGHSGLGPPLLHSHLLCLTLFHSKSHPLLTFYPVFIGCLSSQLFLQQPLHRWESEDDKDITLSLSLSWMGKKDGFCFKRKYFLNHLPTHA